MSVNQVVSVQPQVKQTGGTGKAVASGFIPGLGQFCDGRNKEGLAYLGAAVGTQVAGYALAKKISNHMLKVVEQTMRANPNVNPAEIVSKASQAIGEFAKKSKLGAIATVLLPLAGFGIWIANIADAYKGDR